jgi:hypothetical protein
MALPAFTPDIGILQHLPADKEAARIYRALVGVIVEGDVYRTARPGVWQLETFMAPHIVRRAIERAGMDVLSIEPDDAAPGCVYYVRFAPEPYCGDNDWPAAPYQGVNPWHIIDWPRAPKAPRTDAVAGPAGVVLCNLETTPAALIPVPGAPGLDYTYADMGMVEAAPVVEPTPPAPKKHTITYGQRVLEVAEIVRTRTGSVYARVNISTSARVMWHCVLIARVIARVEGKAA